MSRKLLVASGVLLALAGCTNSKLVGRSDLGIVSQEALPLPNSADLLLQQRAYAVGPLDRVIVDVYGAPDLSRSAQVDAGGNLALPLIGNIAASGRTSAQLADVVASRLRGKYVRDPKVTVTVDTFNQMVTVDGQVANPGMYPVSGRMTLIRAVASARGLTADANADFVVVFREVSGKKYAALYSLKAIREGQYIDPELYANDVVTVGESSSRRLYQSLLQAGAVFAGPAIAILR